MKKPTRIIEKPFLEKVRGYQRRVMVCLCDNGLFYTVHELGKIAGIHFQTVFQRISIYGWDSPLILRGRAEPGKTIKGELFDRQGADSGNAAWKRLGGKPRNKRLDKIPMPGTFERRL